MSHDKNVNESIIEGRNAVMEAFRSGKPVDKLYVLDGCQDGAVRSIIREARKHDTILNFVEKDRLNQLSETGKHQGVIASVAAYEYAEVEDMLKLAEEKGEDPFLIILDNIEDPHNLGAIIRTANQAGAHGVIIPKRRAVGLTATVARTSAGALNYTPVAKVTNLVKTMEDLKKKGLWFVCADMDGDVMYDVNMKGPIGLVIGNEGEGVGRLVKDTCDFTARIPMKGDIDSLNASVAAGVLAYEKLTDEELIRRLRMGETGIIDYLMEKYKNLVRKEANAMYLLGGETDDLIQEGMIGLFKAIRDYDDTKETSFFHFAELCITRQLYKAVEASNRKKHAPLNSYVSFYSENSENGYPLAETLIDQENVAQFWEKLRTHLSKMEREVLDQYLAGFHYQQIAEKMGKSPKSIDNALSRIKAKIREMNPEIGKM